MVMKQGRFVVPSQIPWESLKGRELEECLFWLIDSMGGKDIEWRVGGHGGGAADEGRDLECRFYVSNPEGDLNQERWWIEAKGSTRTVSPTEVKAAVLNAAGRPGVDVLVVATNAQFSNPTRDWAHEWQENHKRPRIRLWEKSNLEQLCSKHPSVVVRLFSDALSSQGKLELVRSRLWNYSILSDQPTLATLWNERDSLSFSRESILALIFSECANGNLTVRPWGTIFEGKTCLETLALGWANLPVFLVRATQGGTKEEPFFDGLAYLMLVALDKCGRKKTEALLEVYRRFFAENYPGSRDSHDFFFKPVLSTLALQVRDVCVSDCSRVCADPMVLREGEIDVYWDRLLPRNSPTADEEIKRFLVIEKRDEPCKVGLPVDLTDNCPICRYQSSPDDLENLSDFLGVLETILKARKPKPKPASR